MKKSQIREPAQIVRELGPFPETPNVGGVTFDGERGWFAGGNALRAFDPDTGAEVQRLNLAADAGTAFDGRYLYQLTSDRIHKIDPETGSVVASIPAPGAGRDSGLAWAEGTLWVGQYRDRKIHQIDPETGRILSTIQSDCFVTGVTFCEGEFWHGTQEDDKSELRRVDHKSGEVLECLEMPAGTMVSGLEWRGSDEFLCGGGNSGKVRVVRRPKRRTR